MLHIKTVEPRTFSLLKKLMEIPELKDFYLVGGTALSLMYGHRISEDLDLFSTAKFDNLAISDSLVANFKEKLDIRTSSHFGIFCYIDDIKVGLIKG